MFLGCLPFQRDRCQESRKELMMVVLHPLESLLEGRNNEICFDFLPADNNQLFKPVDSLIV
jgi:hypothetical protein